MTVTERATSKVPPQDLEAEAVLLGGILSDSRDLDRVVEIINVADFYHDAHRTIFETMLAMSNRGEPIDLVTLADALKARSALSQVDYLAELSDKVPSSANIAHYAGIVRDKAVLRRLIEASNDIAGLCYKEGQADVKRLLDEAEYRIGAVSNRLISTGFVPVCDKLLDTVKTVEQLYRHKEMVSGVPTGFLDLDQKTAGLQPADLVIIASRPSMGKTAFALNIAQYVALHVRTTVGIFSLETKTDQVTMRLLCAEARVDQGKVRTGTLSTDDIPELASAAGRLADAPIYIDDTPGLNVSELRTKARRLKRDHNLGIIMIDYLQLMNGRFQSAGGRAQELAEISRGLKALAKEMNVPVVALSQLNRQVELRANKRPAMKDIRDSGNIEDDADLILFIYRDEMYHPDSADEGTAEIIIGKQRNGPIGTVRLAFRSEYTRFENLAGNFADVADGEALTDGA